MRMSTIIAAILAVAVSASLSSAQGVPPALMVESAGRSVPLRITHVEVDARIFGYLAQTSMKLTFHNPQNRPLAGELYFPLPQGATVSGYALDIQGKLVDGVVIEKDRGRQVLEKEIRKGVDPGLVEWTRGNNFRTRVFPIPARGSRTVRVQYVSELPPGSSGTSWGLPLNFRQKVDSFRLRVEVVRAPARPVVARGGPEGLAFQPWQDGFAAEKTLQGATLSQDLVIDLPETQKQKVLVEKDDRGDVYFMVNDFPQPPAAQEAGKPKRIVLFWDASGSRGRADRKRETELLKRFLAGADVQVDVVVFRDAAEPMQRFQSKGGDASALLAHLEKVPYDGGTQLGCISPGPDFPQPDLYLLFSDGLSTIGREDVVNLKAPLLAISADVSANHPLLESLAARSGGQYLNLARLDDAAALTLMGKPVFSFLSASLDGKDVAAADLVYPSLPQAVQGRFSLAGRLTDVSKPATVILSYGLAGKASVQSTVEISPAQAASGTMLRRLWAQKKVDQLMAHPKANEAEIVATGKAFGLVTPGTSLIVLETLEQYLEHAIAPPRTLPEMRDKYLAEMDARTARKKQEDASKLDRVLAMWQQRLKWWETEFKYPKDFKYRDQDKKDAAPARDGGQGGGGAFMPRVAAPAPAAPRLPASPAERTAGLFAEDLPKNGKPGADSSRTPEPGVVIKEWDPKTPYIEAIKKAPLETRYEAYLAQRKAYAASPAFFLDCGDYFLKNEQEAIGLRVLSNLAELELENAALIRVLAYKLFQVGQLELAAMLFEEALKMRPEEPQSFRDLALVLSRRAAQEQRLLAIARMTPAQAHEHTERMLADYRRSLELLAKVVMNKWDRFEEIEVIALMELNEVWAEAQRAAPGQLKCPVDERLIKLLDCDVRIVMTWDADMTDMDLHVVEPSGERAFYGHNRTTIGGLVSKDFTQGYGPEEYILRKAMHGMYRIEANFYGSSAASVQGAVTVQAEVITNFGRANEKRRSLTLRLTEKKETFEIGKMEF